MRASHLAILRGWTICAGRLQPHERETITSGAQHTVKKSDDEKKEQTEVRFNRFNGEICLRATRVSEAR